MPKRVQQRKDEAPLVTELKLRRRRPFGRPVQALKVFCEATDLVLKYSRLLSMLSVKEGDVLASELTRKAKTVASFFGSS
jgi:hypothetical protein